MLGKGWKNRKGKRRRGENCSSNNLLYQKECICPECRTIVPHKMGTPCYLVKCPKCGSAMMGRFKENMDKTK